MNARRLLPRVDVVLAATAVAVVMNLWRVPELIPQLAVLRPTVLTLLVALGLYVLDRHPARQLGTLRTPITVPLVLFLALVVATLPFSLDPGFSTSYLFVELIPRVLLTVLIVAAVRNRNDLELLLLAVLVGGALYTLYALVRIPLGPEGKWTALVDYDNNDFALIAISVLPLGVYFLRRDAGRLRRIIALLSLLVLLAGIVRSGSRGGMIGLMAVAAYLALRYRAVPARVRVAATVIGGLALVGVAGAELTATIDTVMHPQDDYNWAGGDYYGRIQLWKRGLQYMHERPLTGVGLSAFPIAEGELSEVARARMAHGLDVKQLVAHNMYVQVGAELGLVSLGIFVFLLWRTYRGLHEVRELCWNDDGGGMPPEQVLARVLTAALLGFCVSAIFIAAAYFTYLFVLFGFAGALMKLAPSWAASRDLVEYDREIEYGATLAIESGTMRSEVG